MVPQISYVTTLFSPDLDDATNPVAPDECKKLLTRPTAGRRRRSGDRDVERGHGRPRRRVFVPVVDAVGCARAGADRGHGILSLYEASVGCVAHGNSPIILPLHRAPLQSETHSKRAGKLIIKDKPASPP